MSSNESAMEEDDDDEISQKLRTGEYRLVKPVNKYGKSYKSAAWKIWHWVFIEDEKLGDKIACIHCKTVKDYHSSMGTSNLLKHKDECLNTAARKSLSQLARNEEKTIKKLVKKKVVQFVAQDIRALRTPSCPGFLALANTFIAIGHRYGPLNLNDI